jgi:alpha-1,3-rhamnosyl/mannosyltransferase
MAKIGIDVRKAADFGIGRYIQQLVHGLAGEPAGHSFCLFGGPAALAICRRATGGDPRFKMVPENSRPYSLAEHFSMPLALRRTKIDLYHSTHYVLQHGPLPRRVVTSVHDLIHLIFPQYLPSRAALIYARHFIRRAARRSDAVITGSAATRADLLSHCPGADGERLRVIPYGVDGRFRPAATAEKSREEREELRLLGIDGPYLLYVGNFKPHKNLSGVLEAYGRYQAMTRGHLALVLVGRELSFQHGLDRLAAELPDPGALIALGHQPDRLLPLLYRQAELFLFPSLYEGFGLPPLEALACGTPVLASRCGSLEEVLGDAAHYCNPVDADEMARAIHRLAADPVTAEKAAALGPARAGRFCWSDTARKTLGLYADLLGKDDRDLEPPFVERSGPEHIECQV